MNSTTLYQQILGLRSPWRVADVKLDLPGKLVEVRVVDDALALHECPCCGKACPGYDHRVRQWRHLDTCHGALQNRPPVGASKPATVRVGEEYVDHCSLVSAGSIRAGSAGVTLPLSR